jgi:hypothetical protein
MKKLIPYKLQDGGSIWVEIEEEELEGITRAGLEDITEKTAQHFDQALEGIKPAALLMFDTLRDLGPEKVQLEFGLNMKGQLGAVFASASGEANFKVTLIWSTKSG